MLFGEDAVPKQVFSVFWHCFPTAFAVWCWILSFWALCFTSDRSFPRCLQQSEGWISDLNCRILMHCVLIKVSCRTPCCLHHSSSISPRNHKAKEAQKNNKLRRQTAKQPQKPRSQQPQKHTKAAKAKKLWSYEVIKLWSYEATAADSNSKQTINTKMALPKSLVASSRNPMGRYGALPGSR